MVLNAHDTVKKLTTHQKQCIQNLTESWKTSGYCQLTADLLHVLGDRDLYGLFSPLVERKYDSANPALARHRLTEKGTLVKSLL